MTQVPVWHGQQTQLAFYKLQTALTFRTYVDSLFPAYLEFITALTTDKATRLEQNLQQFLQQNYADRNYATAFTSRIGATLLRSLQIVDNFLTPYRISPTSFGLQARHGALLMQIQTVNHTLRQELASRRFPMVNKSIMDRQQLGQKIHQLAQMADAEQLTSLWNTFVQNTPRDKTPTESYRQCLGALRTFLTTVLEGSLPESEFAQQKLRPIVHVAQSPLLALDDAQWYFLSSQMNQSKDQGLLNLVSQFVQNPTPAHATTVAQPDKPLDQNWLNQTLAADPALHNNVEFVTSLYHLYQHDPDLQLSLLKRTLEQDKTLRRQLKIDPSQERFNRRITIDYWLHDMLVNLCRLAFDQPTNTSLTELTRDTLKATKAHQSGIERVYGVVEKLLRTNLLSQTTEPVFKPMLQMLPGLNGLSSYNNDSVSQGLESYRRSIPYQYLKSSYQMTPYPANQLVDFIAHSPDPELVSFGQKIKATWSQMPATSRHVVQTKVLNQFFALAPYAMADKFYPNGLATEQLFAWSKLTEWYQKTVQQVGPMSQASSIPKGKTRAPETVSKTHRTAYQRISRREADAVRDAAAQMFSSH